MKTQLITAVITQSAKHTIKATSHPDKRYKGGLKTFDHIEIFSQLVLTLKHQQDLCVGAKIRTLYGEFRIINANRITDEVGCVSMTTYPIQTNPIIIYGEVEYELVSPSKL